MKWPKFRALADQYPWLAEVVDPCLILTNPQTNSYEPHRINRLRDFVKQKVHYVAPRPFERLNLQELESWWKSQNTLECALCTDSYFGGDPSLTYGVFWTVVYHVGNSGHLYAPLQDERSLFQLLQDIETNCCPAEADALVFDATVKAVQITRRGVIKEMYFDIFTFPPYFSTKPPEKPKWVPLDVNEAAARRAYVRGEPMPPLIPGTLRFA